MSSRPEFMKMKTYFAIKSTMKHWNEDGEREWSCNWIIPEECCFIYARSCFLVVSYSVNICWFLRSNETDESECHALFTEWHFPMGTDNNRISEILKKK